MSFVLHPSGHIDSFARSKLPPADQWPVMHADGAYATPARLNAAVELLDRAIDAGCADHIALLTQDANGTWVATTYGALAADVDALAHVMTQEMQLVSGNRVLLRGFNGRWMTVAWLAAIKAGQLGKKVLLVDRDKLGGECFIQQFNYGFAISSVTARYCSFFNMLACAFAQCLNVG